MPRAYFDGKELIGGEPGTIFTVNDTLTMRDGVLGVTLPIKALTSSEYNTLSEEEKMEDVQYIITDDNSDSDIQSLQHRTIGRSIHLAENQEQIRADVDYISVMTGVDLL